MASLEEQLAEVERDLDELTRENTLLEDHFRRRTDDMDPAEFDEQEERRNKKTRKQTPGDQATKKGMGPTFLPPDQKFAIAVVELEELGKDIMNSRSLSEKDLDDLRAQLEVTNLRIAEVKKDAYEFKRDIVVGAENPRTGKTMAERVVKYLEDRMRDKDNQIEKLTVKNATIKAQIDKIKSQLKQKEEMGDELKFIDFHQLQIENKQYVARIEEANEELMTLKNNTGHTVQTLYTKKKQLEELITESEWLKTQIADRKDALVRIAVDVARVTEEKAAAVKDNKRLKLQQQMSPEMPQVLDYVNQKNLQLDLEHNVKGWERKVELVEVSAKRAKLILQQAAAMGIRVD